MLYNYLKILHIISAALLLTSIVYSYKLWRRDSNTLNAHVQAQTWLIVIPLGLFQLVTGFTMISVQHYDFHALWVKGSIIGFMLAISSWFGFIYFSIENKARRAQTVMLLICLASLLSMVFFMANKI